MTGFKRVLAILLTAICICCFASCSYGGTASDTPKKMDMLSLELSELEKYMSVGQYKGMEISVVDGNRGDAVWNEVINGATVKSYPESQVYYYMDQLRGQYKYYAEQAGVSYEEMLESLGIDEGGILKEAKALTKGDILYAIILKRENISLSEDEKQTHFSKYVDKYVSEYGYTKEYVEENLAEEIYGSMLYDKTTEFLIVNNIFE